MGQLSVENAENRKEEERRRNILKELHAVGVRWMLKASLGLLIVGALFMAYFGTTLAMQEYLFSTVESNLNYMHVFYERENSLNSFLAFLREDHVRMRAVPLSEDLA